MDIHTLKYPYVYTYIIRICIYIKLYLCIHSYEYIYVDYLVSSAAKVIAVGYRFFFNNKSSLLSNSFSTVHTNVYMYKDKYMYMIVCIGLYVYDCMYVFMDGWMDGWIDVCNVCMTA